MDTKTFIERLKAKLKELPKEEIKDKLKENLKEKLVFRISALFWRFLAGLAGLAVVVGVLFLLWSGTPTFKPSVKKDKYPPQASVVFEELYAQVVPEKDRQPAQVEESSQVVASKAGLIIADQPTELAVAQAEYEHLIDSLKTLIPPAKYAWKSKGHWDYPYGKSYWEHYKTSRYRNWQVDRLGIAARLKSAYRKAGAGDFETKRQQLEAYIAVVVRFPEEKRAAALGALTTYPGKTVAQAVANAQLLAEAIPNFSLDRVDYLDKLAVFGKKNPNDGRAFIVFANRTLNRFDPEVRFKVLQTLIAGYYRHFNNRISQQVEITASFLSVLDRFEPKYQVAALNNYYPMYLQKNRERARSIENIDYQYERDLSDSQSIFYRKKAAKAGWRMNGFYAIGGGIAVIAFLALVLALLSIQRNLEKVLANVEKGTR